MERRVVWDKSALKYFRESIDYIRKKSPKNAEKVKKDILEKIDEIALRPEIHNPDKYKTSGSATYRCFELHRLRIAYLSRENRIYITRVRSTNQEPMDY
jgi:plasmid stabilization system protein ParE